MGLIEILSHLIAEYEDEHYKNFTDKGVDALKFLMESVHLICDR